MLRVEVIYWLIGAFLLVAAAMDVRARRWSNAAFWAILAVPFLAVANAMITAMLHSHDRPAPIDEHGDTETAPHHESEVTEPPGAHEGQG